MVREEKAKILVVDDEAGIRDYFYSALSQEDYEVLTASSGEEAVDLVRKDGFDLVLLDIKLPGIDGIEALRQIRKIDEDIVVIMITAFATLKTAVAALKEGAYDYVTKPFNLNEIIATVKRGLEKRRLIIENRELAKRLKQKVVVTKKRLTITTK